MNLVQKFIATLCRGIATPRALTVNLLVEAGEWKQLQELRCEPSHYSDSESYWRDCLVTDILRKCDLESGVDREQAAVDTFLACESQNCRTNVRLARYFPENLAFLESEAEVSVSQFIIEWRKEVSRVLGSLPVNLTPRFSGGATFGDTGKLTTIPDKMSSVPTITAAGRALLPFWEGTSWERSLMERYPRRHTPRTVRGNIFFTVPKDGKTYRGCCKEPSINVSFQLDVGRLMKKRLFNALGIDLYHGQDLHRRIACEASLSGEYATMDMSNASDTLCRNLVKLLVRDDWLSLLEALRATHTRVRGRWYRLEKFSSMGNGFTFELESLLFVTLARCIVSQSGGNPDLVKCYGDDLIAPVRYSDDILRALEFFGFTPNRRKTFTEGPFRESCGGDFFSGVPVRAHFLKELPDEPQKWISLANGIRRSARASESHPERWDAVRPAWRECLGNLPSDIRRCRGPEHLGDIVIHDEPSAWKPRRCDSTPGLPQECREAGWDVEWVRAYTPIQGVLPWWHWHPAVQLASCTLGLPSTGVSPRDMVVGYKFRWVVSNLTNQWIPSQELTR